MQLAELRALKPQIMAIAEKYGVSNIRVFGSVARGDADEKSDVDLLIDMEEKRSLMEVVSFKQDMEDFLHCHVDVVEEVAIKNPLRKNYILQDATLL